MRPPSTAALIAGLTLALAPAAAAAQSQRIGPGVWADPEHPAEYVRPRGSYPPFPSSSGARFVAGFCQHPATWTGWWERATAPGLEPRALRILVDYGQGPQEASAEPDRICVRIPVDSARDLSAEVIEADAATRLIIRRQRVSLMTSPVVAGGGR